MNLAAAGAELLTLDGSLFCASSVVCSKVRYEDLVHDMPGMANAIIAATGLDWHEDVLKFHKKKHAVNTLSTTQVRKGIYKDSLQSWRKYEEQLHPLVELIGERVDPQRETTLPGYIKPAAENDSSESTE